MTTTIELMPIGAPVEIRGGVRGWVWAIRIDGAAGDRHAVTYSVRWWDGYDLREAWFLAAEIVPDAGTEPLFLGFPR